MKWIDIYGNLKEKRDSQEEFLSFVYGHAFTRALLKPFTYPWFSKLGGWFMSGKFSTVFVKNFIKKNDIDMSDYPERPYKSFNDFFDRELLPGKRPFETEDSILMSPCDGKVTALTIDDDLKFTVKHTVYTLESLTGGHIRTEEYKGGTLLILRLAVNNYHHYHFPDDGTKEEDIFLPGVLHTVNPIANDYVPIYKINQRSLSLLHTKHFDDVAMIEVGAQMVGRIVNLDKKSFTRGEEKGYFEFGGSTVILLLKKDAVTVDEHFFKASEAGLESEIFLGMRLGSKMQE